MQAPESHLAHGERRGDRTRARLMEAALDEFRRVGVNRASVSRISRMAGTSRPSFYFHFATKQQVLVELQKHLERPVGEAVERCTTLREAVRCLVEGLAESKREIADDSLYADMLAIYTKRPRDPLLDEDQPIAKAVVRQFAEGAARGELRAELDPAQAAELFLAGVLGYMIGTRSKPTSFADDMAVFTSLFLNPVAG